MTSRQSFGDFPPKSIIFLILIIFGSFLVDIKNTRYHKPNAMQICTNQSPKFEQTCEKISSNHWFNNAYPRRSTILFLTHSNIDIFIYFPPKGKTIKISILKNVIKISYNNPQIESSEDQAKHVLKISGL